MSVSRGPLKAIADTLICPYCGTQNAVYPGKTDRIDPGRLEEALITGGPMPNLISEFSISVFLRGHAILSEVLRKGEAHALERNIAPSVLLTARLFPDMLPLTRQVQLAVDTAKRTVARLAAIEPSSSDNNETTFGELQSRINNTSEFIKAHAADTLTKSAERIIEFKMGQNTASLPINLYIERFALPNFYFHLTTAYNIMRHNGVVLGKMDYLGDLALPLGT